jgi:hypothetical protein
MVSIFHPFAFSFSSPCKACSPVSLFHFVGQNLAANIPMQRGAPCLGAGQDRCRVALTRAFWGADRRCAAIVGSKFLGTVGERNRR